MAPESLRAKILDGFIQDYVQLSLVLKRIGPKQLVINMDVSEQAKRDQKDFLRNTEGEPQRKKQKPN